MSKTKQQARRERERDQFPDAPTEREIASEAPTADEVIEAERKISADRGSTMNTYEVYNTKSGAYIGAYEGETPAGAIAAMLGDAGSDEDPAADVKAVQVDRCIYCGSDELFPVDAPVPAVDDDQAWGRLAEMHDPGCEWIKTRAHRVTEG